MDILLSYFSDLAPKILSAAVLIALGLVISQVASSLLRHTLQKSKVDITVAKFLGTIIKWIILLGFGISTLSVFGVQTTSLAAALAAIGFAVGMALQGTLSSFSAGVMLLIFRPFKVGDVVKVSGEVGTIDEIQLFNIILDTADKRRLFIPNNQVFGNKIENISYHPVRRLDLPVGVAYSADSQHVRKTLEQALQEIPAVLAEPAPQAILTELADSSVTWNCRAWVKAEDFWSTREKVLEKAKQHLDQAGIEIPFPHMEVFIRKQVDGMATHE